MRLRPSAEDGLGDVAIGSLLNKATKRTSAAQPSMLAFDPYVVDGFVEASIFFAETSVAANRMTSNTRQQIVVDGFDEASGVGCVDTVPTMVSRFNIHAGERVDIVVCANQNCKKTVQS